MDSSISTNTSTGPSRASLGHVVSYIESLRRIAQSLNSGMDLRSVLQAIVDALCDNTAWQLCFVYAMDTRGGFAEIAARRDRIEYTTRSPQERWPISENPAIDALTRNEIIAIADVASADSYPRLQASAANGIVSSAYVPLSSSDPQGRPMVLSVQSTKPVLSDEIQLPFLRAVASLASLAATNAGLLSEARQAAAWGVQNAATLSDLIEGVSAGTPSSELLAEIEQRTGHAIVIFDHHGAVSYVGRAPLLPTGEPVDEWDRVVSDHRREWADVAASVDQAAGAPAVLPIGDHTIAAAVTKHGRGEAVITFFTIPLTGERSGASVGTAVALVMVRDRIQNEARLELQYEVLSQLVHHSFHDPYELRSRAAHVGINLDQPAVLAVVAVAPGSAPVRLSVTMRLQAKHWPGAVVDHVDGHWVFVLPLAGGDERRSDTFVDSLVATSVRSAAEVGLTVTRSAQCQGPDDYAEAWQHCLRTVDLAQRLGRVGVVRVDEFGAFRLLLPALGHGDLQEFIRASVGVLLEYDAEHQSALFDTMEAFTNLAGRYNDAARELSIHVSTLRYRLQKIEALLGRSISEPDARFDLLLAARLERLRRAESPQLSEPSSTVS